MGLFPAFLFFHVVALNMISIYTTSQDFPPEVPRNILLLPLYASSWMPNNRVSTSKLTELYHMPQSPLLLHLTERQLLHATQAQRISDSPPYQVQADCSLEQIRNVAISQPADPRLFRPFVCVTQPFRLVQTLLILLPVVGWPLSISGFLPHHAILCSLPSNISLLDSGGI